MTNRHFPQLFSPLTIGGATVANRIFSTGHDTSLTSGGRASPALIAYHAARAQAGAGLIVTQVASVHETALYSSHILRLDEDAFTPEFAKLAAAIHAHGTRVFGQLFHPGREIMEGQDGTIPPAYAPSAVPSERFHVMPVPLSLRLIAEIVAGFGAAARRYEQAGYDGCEIVASHGYLPLQFLNPTVNLRTDRYGGSLENRARFLAETLSAIRAEVSSRFVVGVRITGDERDDASVSADEVLRVAAMLEAQGGLDYVNVIAGSSKTFAGAIHIVPPMAIEGGYVAPFAAAMKQAVKVPVFVAGRINQPQQAEKILAAGAADMIGMTRAMIADPLMAGEGAGRAGRDIRACIACNQACIGHFHKGYGISCIQHPETGRELTYGTRVKAIKARKVLVAGGGPAGLKAAAVAAERGHRVTLYERAKLPGGQVLLAQLLPGRQEFGGLATNLLRECELADVTIHRSTEVTRALVEREAPDAIIVATGAKPRWPQFEGREGAHVADAWQVLRGEVNVGKRRGDRRLAAGLDRHRPRAKTRTRGLPRAAVRTGPARRRVDPVVRARFFRRRTAQGRRRGDPLCPALRHRRRNRVFPARRLRRADADRGRRYAGAEPGPRAGS